MKSNQQVMLIDGMSLLFRGFYAMPIRKTSEGIPTNAIYQWIRYFNDAFQTFQPTHVICCWDLGSKTFRTDQYSAYKANRSAPPADLIPQFELIKEVIEESFSIPNIGVIGYEADDIIGTLSTMYREEMDVLILTGDHDFLQLIDERIKVAIMRRGMGNYTLYCPRVFTEERNITPKQFIDMKAFMGDASDNIPGVKGIGEIGALKLIREYKHIQGVLDNLDNLTPALRRKIEADIDMLHLSKKLVTIRCDIPLDINLDDCFWDLDRDRMKNKFKQLEIHDMDNLF